MAEETQVNIVEAFLPLYNFSADADVLQLTSGTEILAFNGSDLFESAAEELDHVQYFKTFPPPFLLRTRVAQPAFGVTDGKLWIGVSPLVLKEVSRLLTTLRLFQPGWLRSGVMFVHLQSEPFDALSGHRVSGSLPFCLEIPYLPTFIEPETTPYALTRDQLPVFQLFVDRIKPALESSLEVRAWPIDPGEVRHPELAVALRHLNRSYESREYTDQVVDLLISLEALVLGEEQELSYKLAMRTACLLGKDSAETADLFKRAKMFYRQRSKVVHGVPIAGIGGLEGERVEELRHIVRRVLLAVIALRSEPQFANAELGAELDALILNDQKRREMQAIVRRFWGSG